MTTVISHRQIQRKLESSEADLLPAALRRLARAVWNIRTDRKAHARCRTALPTLVDAEMDGKLALYDASVREHLLICNRCSSLYAELLEISMLDSFGRMPSLTVFPSPDLSFLETPHD